MKKLISNSTAKLIAVLLLCAMVLLFLTSILCLIWLQDLGAFSNGREAARQSMFSELGQDRIYQIRDLYFYNGYRGEDIYPHTNLRFSIIRDTGEELYNNYSDEDALWSGTLKTVIPSDWSEGNAGTYDPEAYYEIGVTTVPPVLPVVTPTPRPIPTDGISAQKNNPDAASAVTETPSVTSAPSTLPDPEKRTDPISTPWPTPEPTPTHALAATQTRSASAIEKQATATVHAWVLSDLKENDEFAFRDRLFSTLYGLRYLALTTVIVSALVGALLFVFLIAAAGRRDSDGTITPGWLERIPYDIFLILCMVLFMPVMVILDSSINFSILGFILLGGVFLYSVLLLLVLCMSTAVRLRTHTLWSSCLLVRLCRGFSQRLLEARRSVFRGLRKLPLIRRDVLLVLAAFALEFLVFWVLPSFDGDIAVVLILKDLIVLTGICWLLLGFRRLRLGARALASGELNTHIATDRLLFDMKEHAEDLNRISDGMNKAVEERLKSERFRTELITNVSHDIKTPLTSIINYVDLLQKENPQNETEREYLDVLGRQSEKLKKLIEDLIEASKASTGSLPVNPERCDLHVLMQQMLGEYEERFRAASLTPILSAPEGSEVILADGRHMWRIYDNLMGNICKYAQPGTRVYLRTERSTNEVLATFRNISRDILNVSVSELTERFARGDSARSTEGNGLGLAIAESLTHLQGGEMKLTLDGDLFKVELRFQLLQEQIKEGYGES